MGVFSCVASRPDNLGVKNGRLAPCPPTPNCVSSDVDDASHHIAPLQTKAAVDAAWPRVREIVAAMPRTKIISETAEYLHAECSSALFGFVDDLELHARPAQRAIAVRSAARVGYSDFGVNRRRVEALRAKLAQQGVVR